MGNSDDLLVTNPHENDDSTEAGDDTAFQKTVDDDEFIDPNAFDDDEKETETVDTEEKEKAEEES